MSRKRAALSFLLLAALLMLLAVRFIPLVIISSGEETLYRPVRPGAEMKYHYIHSVEQTPVEEYFEIIREGFKLKKTIYSSYGAGLPLEGGDFSRENGRFVIANQDQIFPGLTYRVSSLPEQYLKIGGRQYNFQELADTGQQIKIETGSLPESLLK